MSHTMVHPDPQAVKTGRFVAATPDQQANLERQIGRNYYRRGRDIEACTTDDMTAGWLACEAAGERFGWKACKQARGEDAYWRAMMADASTVEVM